MPPKKRRRTQTRKQKSTTKTAKKAKPNYATIIDLPNEILLMVLEKLTESDLYNLALLCRRLHVVALSLFFKKRKVNTSGDAVDISPSHNTFDMAAVGLALFIRRLNRLEYVVVADDEYTTHCLNHLILRMSAVSTVLFSLRVYHPILLSTNPLPTLMKSLGYKKCQSLSISAFGHTHDTKRPIIGVPPIVTLMSFRIDNPVLLRPRWLTWTAKSLQSSPLTCLDVTNCMAELANALPSFTLPHLSELRLACMNLPVSVLAPFLSRHPTIRTLKLLSLQPDVPIKTQLFPSLISLHGDTIGLTHLLAKPMSFPHLKTIHAANLMCQTPASIAKFFKNVTRTPASYLATKFIAPDDRLRPWLRSFRRPRRKNQAPINLAQITAIRLCTGRLSELRVDLSLWLSLFPELDTLELESRTFRGTRNEEQLAFIEHLSVECPRIQIVKLNGVGGTLEDWRSEKQHYIAPLPME